LKRNLLYIFKISHIEQRDEQLWDNSYCIN
jgi:hypothetical protein